MALTPKIVHYWETSINHEQPRKMNMTRTLEIKGTITGIKVQPNPHNFNRTTVTKMIVEDSDGARYHGTRPHSLVKAEIGDTVRLKAEVAPSGQVKKWFFFQRPRMAVIV